MIKLPRGNTLCLSVALTDIDGAPYILGENDKAIFTAKRNDKRNEAPFIKKILTAADCNPSGEIEVKIRPEDTMTMEKGDYVFDFAVCVDGEDFYTTVIADTLRILPALGDKEAVLYG